MEGTKYLTSDIIPALKAKVDAKQDVLVSGTNIKTINGQTVLGAGDIEIADKLYDTTGENTDGAMTQKAVTDVVNGLETATAKTVQLDTTIADDKTSTVTLVKTTGALNSDETVETSLALPVASATQAGVMNPTTYETIQNNAATLEAMVNGSVLIENLAADADQAALTAAWKEATGLDELLNGARIYDKTNNKIWTYYSNVAEWEPSDISAPELELNNFTNTAAGVIKGSETGDGKVFAEADGTGSVLGWDTLSAGVADNTSAIATLQTGKQDTLVDSGDGQNIKTINGTSLLGSGDIEISIADSLVDAAGYDATKAISQRAATALLYPIAGEDGALLPNHIVTADNTGFDDATGKLTVLGNANTFTKTADSHYFQTGIVIGGGNAVTSHPDRVNSQGTIIGHSNKVSAKNYPIVTGFSNNITSSNNVVSYGWGHTVTGNSAYTQMFGSTIVAGDLTNRYNLATTLVGSVLYPKVGGSVMIGGNMYPTAETGVLTGLGHQYNDYGLGGADGPDSSSATNGVTFVGRGTQNTGCNNLLLGNEAMAGSISGLEDTFGVNGAVALGFYSRARRSGEVSVGSGIMSHDTNPKEYYTYRYIANVRAGELDHDAVNLAQVRELIAAAEPAEPTAMTVDEFNSAWDAA